MGSDLGAPLAIYPMVEEGEATGRVAAVYAGIERSMPFVPSLFKSLAVCPAYLVLAWDQASHALAGDELAAAAHDLVAAAAGGAPTPPDDAEVREALDEFVEPLSRMLLLAAGLLHAAEGRVDGRPAAAEPPERGSTELASPVPSQWEAGADATFGDIRRALDTPIVNSIWRSLAGQGLLDRAWAALAPAAPASRPAAVRLQQLAVDRAQRLAWPVVATPQALEAAGVADALPAVTAILDAYVKTLARVLALVAGVRPT